MLAEKMAAAHIVAKQDDPLGSEVVGKVDCLIARVRAVMDHLRVARQTRLTLALNPIQAVAFCCILVLRPAFALKACRNRLVVDSPPALIARI